MTSLLFTQERFCSVGNGFADSFVPIALKSCRKHGNIGIHAICYQIPRAVDKPTRDSERQNAARVNLTGGYHDLYKRSGADVSGQ